MIISENKILLPRNIDLSKWAVIACDQFASQPDYWRELERYVGDSPSTLGLIFPETYLNGDFSARVDKIHENMRKYLDGGIFEEIDGFILTERIFGGKKRYGLVLSVDLEEYGRGNGAKIRATEDTIDKLLPVRRKIREGAEIELPHIILFIDDRERSVIEPVVRERKKLRKLYDFELNMNGGRIRGFEVSDTGGIIEKINRLSDRDLQIKKYGRDSGILFAVGDGNHSMVVAKEHWNKIRPTLPPEARKNHPARFVLVEVANLYDEGIIFEPIHRVVSDCAELPEILKRELKGGGKLELIYGGKEEFIDCPGPAGECIEAVRNILERETERGARVDYVHGRDRLERAAKKIGNVGIAMPEFGKAELFDYVLNFGNLPRKAFSVGGAEGKKYYLEAKRIR